MSKTCMCCGREIYSEYDYLCEFCKLAQMQEEERIRKMRRAAYNEGYNSGAKAAVKYLVDEINKVKEIFPNDPVGHLQAEGWLMCIDELEEIAKEHFGVEVEE